MTHKSLYNDPVPPEVMRDLGLLTLIRTLKVDCALLYMRIGDEMQCTTAEGHLVPWDSRQLPTRRDGQVLCTADPQCCQISRHCIPQQWVYLMGSKIQQISGRARRQRHQPGVEKGCTCLLCLRLLVRIICGVDCPTAIEWLIVDEPDHCTHCLGLWARRLLCCFLWCTTQMAPHRKACVSQRENCTELESSSTSIAVGLLSSTKNTLHRGCTISG